MRAGYNKLILIGSVTALIGFTTSGPAGFMIIKLTKPQPPWQSASVFAANYHFVQDIPYYLGLLLIGGMLMIAAGLYLNYTEENRKVKFQLLLSLLWTAIFATLIFFNYICQTTFIRYLALNYTAQNDSMIATFSMANPMSLSWAVEIWGYGILGVATWLMAGYYKEKNKTLSWLLILNGMVSIAIIGFTIIDLNWVLTSTGLIAYMFWNVLMIVLMIMINRNCKREYIEN